MTGQATSSGDPNKHPRARFKANDAGGSGSVAGSVPLPSAPRSVLALSTTCPADDGAINSPPNDVGKGYDVSLYR